MKILLWLVIGVPLVLLSPILDAIIRVYIYYKIEFKHVKTIIDDVARKQNEVDR